MSSARTPLPTLNERDTEQVRSLKAPRILWLGPCTLQSLLPPQFSSCPCCRSVSLGCPVIWLLAPHIPLPSPVLGPTSSRLQAAHLSFCRPPRLPSPPSCALPCYLPSFLFSSLFLSGAFLVFLHPRLKQPPSCSPSSTLRFAPDRCPPLPPSLQPCVPSARTGSPSPGSHPRGPCPGVCSQSLSSSSSLAFYAASCFSTLCSPSCLQPTSSTLITFPNRSPTLGSSLSLLFSRSSLVPRAGICCFRVSHPAVMRIVFPQVVLGVPVFTPVRAFGLVTISSSGVPRSPVSHCEHFTSLLPELFLPRGRHYFSPTPLTATCCSDLSRPRCITVLPFLSLDRDADRDASLSPLLPLALSIVSPPLLVAFRFLYPHPVFLTVALAQDCLSSPY